MKDVTSLAIVHMDCVFDTAQNHRRVIRSSSFTHPSQQAPALILREADADVHIEGHFQEAEIDIGCPSVYAFFNLLLLSICPIIERVSDYLKLEKLSAVNQL